MGEKEVYMFSRTTVLVCFVCSSTSLIAQSEEFGKWKQLFNGKDLSGWKEVRGKGHWRVEDGALTNGEGGGNICSAETFQNYELELEYRLPERSSSGVRGNSGVYLRGRQEVQISSSSGPGKTTLNDSGAIHGVSRPLKNTSRKPGQWNHFRILHIRNHITVWHNGELVQDNVWCGPSSRPVPDGGTALRGPILLQGETSRIWFRNIRLRPLFGDGWLPLWNGRDLSQFTTNGPNLDEYWKVRENAFTNIKWWNWDKKNGRGHDLWTRDSFGNFLVHYSYRSDPDIEGGNSGFYLRNQWEIQILKTSRTDNAHTDGALYSIYPPVVDASNGPGRWNHMDVKLQGRKIWVWMNGKLIQDGKVCDTRTDNHGVETRKFSRGPFKFQGDHGRVWFTDLYIKPLADGDQ